jgi:hypothetical protein
MKIKEDLMLRNIVGEWIIVPMGERLTEFHGMMKVNASGAFIWKLLEHETIREKIIAAVVEEYDIDEAAAMRAIDEFLDTLSDANVLER